MMFKKVIAILLLLSFSSTFFFSFSVAAVEEKQKVLIVYDIKKQFNIKEDAINVLENLIHHFPVDVDSMSMDQYKKDAMGAYDYVFVCFFERNSYLSEDFLEDAKGYHGQLVWFGEKADRLIADRYPQLQYMGRKSNLLEVNYRDQIYKVPNILHYSIITPVSETDDRVRIAAKLTDGTNSYPYILSSENFHFIARLELSEDILYYILADYLYDIFNVQMEPSGKIFVRIEDVNPLRDAKALKEIADYLYDNHVPFMVALIPAYVNPKNGKNITLSDVPEFAEAIRYMVKKGGQVVLHGYSHQYYKSETGEGFEFWDAKRDAPLKEDMGKWVKERVLLGLKECLNNGINPLAFEPPHYAMSQDGYTELKKYFSTVVAHYQSSDMAFTSSTFPYELKDSKQFHLLIPENMGFVEAGLEEQSIKQIFDKANKLKIVRGYTGGFFFHSYLDIKYLKQIIEGLKDKGFTFLALSDVSNWVKVDDIKISNEGENIVNNYIVPAEDKNGENIINRQFEKPTLYLAIFILIIVLSLTIIFLWYRRYNAKSMFEVKQHF